MPILTFRAYLAYFFYIISCPVVDGVRDSTLADDLVLAGWRGAIHCDIIHRFAQLSGSDTNPTYREWEREKNLMILRIFSLKPKGEL